MSSFQAKIGWKRQRKRENKNYRFVPFLLDCLDKIPKKFKKFQNTIMGSFQAKIGWKRLRKKEDRNYISATFLLDWLEKIPKNQQKNSKNCKIRLRHQLKPKQDGKG